LFVCLFVCLFCFVLFCFVIHVTLHAFFATEGSDDIAFKEQLLKELSASWLGLKRFEDPPSVPRVMAQWNNFSEWLVGFVLLGG